LGILYCFGYSSAFLHQIPPLVPVTSDARELWEDVIITKKNENILFDLIILA
jgi:hypothetical protein